MQTQTPPDRLGAQTDIERFETAAIEALQRAVLMRRSVRGFLPDQL